MFLSIEWDVGEFLHRRWCFDINLAVCLRALAFDVLLLTVVTVPTFVFLFRVFDGYQMGRDYSAMDVAISEFAVRS